MKVTKKTGSKKKTTKKTPVKVTKKTPVSKKKGSKKKASTKSGAGVSATVTTQVGGKKVEEKVEKVLDVITEGPTATIGFNLGTTRAIGDHEFVKATVILTVPVNAEGEIAVDMDKMEAPFNKVKAWCDNRLGTFMEEVGKVMDSDEEGGEEDPLDDLESEDEDTEEEDDLDLDLLDEDEDAEEDEEEDEDDPFGLDEEVDEEVDEDDPFGLDDEEEEEDEEGEEEGEEVEEEEDEEDDDDILSILDGDEETEEETEEEDEDDPLGLGI